MTHEEQRQLDRMEEKLDRFMEMTHILELRLAVHEASIIHPAGAEIINEVKTDVKEVRDFIKKAAGAVAAIGILANWLVPLVIRKI